MSDGLSEAAPRPDVSRYLPGLDGLRAISILLVLFSHVRGTPSFPRLPGWIWHIGDTGNLGVRIFFVISGFLITHLLLKEEARNGIISIKRFYIRRSIRILPALWAFVGFMMLLRLAGAVHFPFAQVLQSLLFTSNYHFVRDAQYGLGHLWSLSVEEQFYLFWPTVLVLAPRRYRLSILGVGICAAPIVRMMLLLGSQAHGLPILSDPPNGFFASMDALAVGCIAAILRAQFGEARGFAQLTSSPVLVLVPFILLGLNGLSTNPWVFLGAVLPLLNVVIAIGVVAASQGGLWGWQTVLDLPPVRWIGRISYSLYLFQQPFLDRNHPSFFTSFPLNLGIAFLLAVTSYYLIEVPALTLRTHLERSVSG